MMDIKGNAPSSLVNVTSLLARVAVDKNREIRELVAEPVADEKKQEASKAVNSSDASTVAPSDASSTNTNAQVTGRVVNVEA